MGVPTLVNAYPPGTRTGSPITVVGSGPQVLFGGPQSYSTGITVPTNAQAGDVLYAAHSIALSTNVYSPTYTQSPSGFLTGFAGTAASNAGPPSSLITFAPFYRVVQTADIGKTIEFGWNGSLNQISWEMFVYCLRFVDTSVVFDSAEALSGSGTTPTSAPTNPPTITTAQPAALIVSCVFAGTGSTNTAALKPSSYVPLYNIAGDSAQPSIGFVVGLIDNPIAGAALAGTSTGFTWQQNTVNPATVNFVGSSVPFRPVPAPSAPSVTLSPSGGSIDAAGTSGTPFTVSWTYTPVKGQGSQEGWLIARQPHAGGTMQYWNADSSAWSTTEYWNLGSASHWTWPAGSTAWADDGTNWDLSVAIRESNLHLKSAVAGPFTFTADAPPYISSVGVSNPNTSTPTVSWTATFTRSPQTKYQVWVYSSDQIAAAGFVAGTSTPRWGSGLVTSAATSVTTGALTGGGTYTAYVQLTQTGGETTPILPVSISGYTNAPTVTWYAGFSAPAKPNLAVAAQNDISTGAPVNNVTVTGFDTNGRSFTDGGTTNASPTLTSTSQAQFNQGDVGRSVSGTNIPANTTILSVQSATSCTMSANATATGSALTITIGGPNYAGTGTAQVQFSDDGGVTWTMLRNASALPLTTLSGQQVSIEDFEIFQGKSRQYQATVNNTSSGVAVSSPASSIVSSTATSSPPSAWFVPPLNPSASTAAEIEGLEQTQLEQLAAHWGLGRRDPIVLFDVVNYKDGSLTIKTINAAQAAAIDTLIAQQATLWLSTPFGDGYYIRVGPEPGGTTTTNGAKVQTISWEPSYIANPVRKIVIPYIVVKRP